jgi:anti-anti-sigma factor
MTAQPGQSGQSGQSAQSFTLTVDAGRGTAHLHLVGDLDHGTGDELTRKTDACLLAHPHLRELHLDCAQLRFCDSMGISALLTLHRRAHARKISLHVDSPPPFLDRLLDLTGIRHLFVHAASPRQSEQTLTNETAAGAPSPPHARKDPS